MHLRILLDGEATPAWNMAVDETLLHHAKDPVLRIYGWDRPAVSIGYFQPISVSPAGREFVRRYTGGGLVDHARDLTYTLVLPRAHPLGSAGTSETYCAIHRAVSQALSNVSIDNKLTPVALEGDASACFQKPVAHDIIDPTTNTKLAGAAQRRNRVGILHQGSILTPAGKKISQALTDQLIQEVSTALKLAVVTSSLTKDEEMDAQQLAESRYATEEWNNSRI